MRSPWWWTILATLAMAGVVLVLELGDTVVNLAAWKRAGGEGSWVETLGTGAVLLVGWIALASWSVIRRRPAGVIALSVVTLILCAMMWIGQRS